MQDQRPLQRQDLKQDRIMGPALRSRESTSFTELQANVSHRKDTEARRAQLSALGGVPGVPPAQEGTHSALSRPQDSS